MKLLFFTSFLFLFSFFIEAKELKSVKSNNNIWIKSYQDYKNYNIIINNIAKIEYKIQLNKNKTQKIAGLQNKLSAYKSKLELYENKQFDTILRNYKYTLPTITLRDFIMQNSLEKLERKIEKYTALKNDFYLAKSSLQHSYNLAIKEKGAKNKIQILADDLEYFSDYTENVEKTYQNLLAIRDELVLKYQEYKNEIFTKHIITLGIVFCLYILYKTFSYALFLKSYKKFLSLLFLFSIFIFVTARYMDDLIYIITFLSVVAAALTIAMREILLNIAGAIYIFFASVLKVGDRVMIQFETKHTIGDVVEVSLVKIKLNEVEDYNNMKEIKNSGRVIYIPNSYIFTKVFYNYSLKKNGLISDILEFEFQTKSDFEEIKRVTQDIFEQFHLSYTLIFTLNSLKTALLGVISYQVNYKEVAYIRGELSIALLQEYQNNENILLKAQKSTPTKLNEEEA